MKRPWQVWLVFAVCVLGAVGAMMWLTREAVDADRERRAAQREAELEQRVSLAVWRMDTELAPVIAAEVIRPSADFRPSGGWAVEPPPYVLLQFEARPDGAWVSPQMPQVKGASPLPQLVELSQATCYADLVPQLPDAPLPSGEVVALNQMAANSAWNTFSNSSRLGGPPSPYDVSANVPQAAAQTPAQPPQQQMDNNFRFFEGNRGANSSPNPFGDAQQQPALNAPSAPDAGQQAQVAVPQRGSKEADFQQRSQRYQSAAARQSVENYNKSKFAEEQVPAEPAPKPTAPVRGELPGASPSMPTPSRGHGTPTATTAEQVGVSRPVWVGERLLLARRVSSGGVTSVQGSWLDWPQLKARLLGEAVDLFPQADLVPVNGNGADDPSRMLAGLPVRMVVNETPAVATVGPTLKTALWMGWGGVLAAVLAAAALLRGVIALSERRAAFVSSVTHELRTPLTTFRMYAEMLAKGMVPDAARRQEYFETLQKESERLTLLVENVLSYARLERGRKPQVQDHVTVTELLGRVRKRLEQRAAQAGMECVVTLNDLPLPPGEGRGEGELSNSNAPSPCPLPRGEGSRNATFPKGEGFDQKFTTDMAVVEQILFNLVDNAAKYARGATDRRIHVEANRNGQYVKLIVRDHGPGIGGGAAERSQPFEKSAQESAETAPGVGLGLALCRRLARELGGRLDVAGAAGDGAEVTLLLPME
jgi:signal transduction histidine kinase